MTSVLYNTHVVLIADFSWGEQPGRDIRTSGYYQLLQVSHFLCTTGTVLLFPSIHLVTLGVKAGQVFTPVFQISKQLGLQNCSYWFRSHNWSISKNPGNFGCLNFCWRWNRGRALVPVVGSLTKERPWSDLQLKVAALLIFGTGASWLFHFGFAIRFSGMDWDPSVPLFRACSGLNQPQIQKRRCLHCSQPPT